MRALIYQVSRLAVKILAPAFVNVRVLRPELGSRQGAWILAANHISHFDPPLIGAVVRRKIDWMAMLELFAVPALGPWMQSVDAFPVDRDHLDRHAVRTAITRLRAGRVLGMFPEGGIRDGAASVLQGAPLRPGVAGLAQMTEAPVIPCVIMGTDRIYALPALWRPWCRIPVWIAFAPPITPAATGDRAAARAGLDLALAAAFRDLAVEMREHFHLSDADFPQPPSRRRAEAGL